WPGLSNQIASAAMIFAWPQAASNAAWRSAWPESSLKSTGQRIVSKPANRIGPPPTRMPDLSNRDTGQRGGALACPEPYYTGSHASNPLAFLGRRRGALRPDH